MKKIKTNFFLLGGFTFVEVVVVISLIVILSSVVVANLNPGRTAEQVKSAQDELASAIKLTQSYALQGRLPQGVEDAPSWYGVEGLVSQKGYKIYYCVKGDPSCGNKNTVEEADFSGGISVTNFDFRFSVPHGVFKLVEPPDSSGIGRATLSKGDSSNNRTLTVEAGGSISKN